MAKQGLKQGLAGVITGASSGIGRALAIELAKRYQARLVLNGRRAEALDETAGQVLAAGGQVVVAEGDISKQEVAEGVVAKCLHHFDGIDLLVNNAGLAKPGPVTSLTPADWQYVFGVNFFGAVYTTYAAMDHMMLQGGKIVNVSSVAGKVSLPGSVCYAASKFALTGMSEGMAAELARYGIDIVTVCPGWVRSEFFENNKHDELRNPTLIAQKKGVSGWLMRKYLSISSEECAEEIIKACEKGGSREIVLTAPGKVAERLMGIAPQAVAFLGKRLPPRT